MDNPFAIARERGQTLDVHAARTGSLTEASQLAGAIVKNHQHVCCYFRSDAATRQGRRQEISRGARDIGHIPM